jgi:hypothetical protein
MQTNSRNHGQQGGHVRRSLFLGGLLAALGAVGCYDPSVAEEGETASVQQAGGPLPQCNPPETVIKCDASKCWCQFVPPSLLSQGRPSLQSSTVLGASANKVNDGNLNGNYFGGSVNHTDFGFVMGQQPNWPGQYWYVDLQSEKDVRRVKISNRTDCCTERLSHFNVLGWNAASAQWIVISNQSNTSSAGVTTFDLPVFYRTRYVMVAKTDNNYLHVAEVQVFGY